MADFITDIAGNKRDKNGQIIGENKVETIKPETPKKRGFKDTVKSVAKDIGTAVRNNQGGLSEGAAPLIQQKQEDQKVIDSISQQSGVPLKSMPENAPVYDEQVPEYLKDPANYDDAKAREEASKNEAPTEQPVVETQTSNVNKLGSEAQPETDDSGAYNVGESDADSIEQGGKDTYSLAKEILDSNNPYKSGADYVKYLWSQGAGGKARALANVLGNVLQGVGGKKTQWEDFTENYQKQEREARETAMSDAMNAIKTANQNQAVRTELVKSLNQAISKGANLSPSEMAAIQQWQTATTPSSALDKAIASIFAKLGIALDNIPTLGKGE